MEDVGREFVDTVGAGVAPHLPKTQPPTFLPIPMLGDAGFRCAMLECSSVRFRVLLLERSRERVPWAVAVHGVTSGPTEDARGVLKRGDVE